MKFAVSALLSLVSANEQDFLSYITKYGKSYATREEYEFRLNIFTKTVAFIEEHNSDPENHRVGLNWMADWT